MSQSISNHPISNKHRKQYAEVASALRTASDCPTYGVANMFITLATAIMTEITDELVTLSNATPQSIVLEGNNVTLQ